MSSLPTRTNISGTPDNATAKTALSALYDFVAQRLARGTTGAGTATAVELAAARDSLGVPMPNWLHNPDGAVYQRTVAATADDVYMDDRWYALTQTNTITPSQVSNPEDGYRYALRLTQSQAVAQRMGRAQIIEGKEASALRGKTVTFGGRLKLSTSANVRMAILAWTGTEDVVTSDVVADWTSGTYTTAGFFNSTTLTLVATTSTAMTAATAGDVSVSGAIPSTATNIIVLYWTEATVAQNVTLDAWGLRLIDATTLTEHDRRSYAQELALCQRFYWRSGSGLGIYGQSYTNTATFGTWVAFPVQMASNPVVTKNGTWTVSGCGQPAVVSSDKNGFTFGASGTSTTNIGVTYVDATTYVDAAYNL